jgi:hypothetical protein
MGKEFYTNRRGFLRTMGLTIAASQLGLFGIANAQSGKKERDIMNQIEPTDDGDRGFRHPLLSRQNVRRGTQRISQSGNR